MTACSKTGTEWQARGPAEGTQAGGQGGTHPVPLRGSGAALQLPWPPSGQLHSTAPRRVPPRPAPRTGHTTNCLRTVTVVLLLGAPQCSWSADHGRTRFPLPSRSPVPQLFVLRDRPDSIFRSTAVKGKALLKQCDAAVLSQETGKGNGAERPGGRRGRCSPASPSRPAAGARPPRPEPREHSQSAPFLRFCE